MPNSVSCNGEIRLSLHLWFETAPPRPIHPDCHTGLPLAPAPLDGFHQDYSSCSMALYMSRVYHPRGMVSTGMEKVLRIDWPDGRRVRKFDGLSGRGLWWRLTPQILKSTSLSSFLPAHPLSGGGWRAQRVGRGRLYGPLCGPGSDSSEVVAAADAADFKECDPLHYFTSPPSCRGAQVIEAPPPPALDNSQLSCYHLLKIRSLGLHTVELRFLSIRNISRSALFSVGRLFLQGSLLLCIFWRFV